jgi:hypothetical protein
MSRSSSDVRADTQWFFFRGGPGAPRYGDDPTKHAVNHDTETFVREVLQNANDQGLDNDDPVEVTFRFVALTGEDKTEFLSALQWGEGLKKRLTTVAASDHGRGYDRLLERVTDPGSELRLLIVEDKNTTGLTGTWTEDSNFAALVRDELYSSKRDDTAGGSYGLGKSVLWTFSGASTVVFNSYLAEGPSAKDSPRLIARTKLPTHSIDGGSAYQGAGWLCRPEQTGDGPRPEALWGEEARHLAERLHVTRPPVSGTSAMVVEYRDPTRDDRPELDELADDFVTAAVKYFWPAIYRGDLEVTVETPEETLDAEVDRVPEIRPFVECFASRYEGEEMLDTPGDVAGLDIPVRLPPRADGTETPNGEVRLSARLASPADDDTYLNHVALFRGAGMVVKYYDQRRIAFGDRNFHGVLACGGARTDRVATASDREIDRFLRFAEPPEHDEWESTENLREQYQRGFRTAIDEMFDTLRDGLRHLVARTRGGSDALSDRVLKRFPIHGNGGRRRSTAPTSSIFDMETSSRFETDRWQFSGRIVPVEEEFEGWTAGVSLTGVGEDGSRYNDVPIASIQVEHDSVTTNIEDGVAHIVAGPTATAVTFEGESERIGHGDFVVGQVGETEIEIRAELETAESDAS